MNPMQSVLDQFLSFIGRKRFVRKVPGSGSSLADGMRFEVDAAYGSGYTVMHRFGNGLEVAHSNQQRIKPMTFNLLDAHTYFGFSLILEGYIDIEIPELEQKERVEAGEIAFRCGRVAQVNPTFPAVPRLRGLTMDIPADMRDAWQSEAPDNLNRGINALLHNMKPPFLRVFRTDEAVMALAEKMLEADTQTSSGRLLYEARALSLLARIIDPGSPPVAHLTRSQIRQSQLQKALDHAIDILRLEWSSPPKITDLARRIGLNHSTMQHEFRQRTGQTIGQYTHRQRMERARELIETGDISVQEAALHVGYSNPSHFSSAFKKYFGYLPSTHRNGQ